VVIEGKPIPLHPLLFAAYAVLFLYASNLSEADLGQVLPVLFVVVAIVGTLLAIGSLLLRDVARAAVLLSVAVVGFFGYRHVAILTSDLPIAGRPVQLLWVTLAIAAIVLVWRGGRPLRLATRALNALGLGLVIVALVTIVPHEVQQLAIDTPAQNPLPKPSDPVAGDQRDIWFLVFDRYGSAESLRLNYGIEEQLTPWLAAQGFHVSPDAHANYVRTGLSLASVLNLDYLDAIPGYETAALALRDHAVGRFLIDRGYRYIHIGSEYGPTRTSDLAENRTYSGMSDFADALFDSSLAAEIAERTGGIKPNRQRRVDWSRFALASLADARNEPGPKFVFAHLLLPHPPYVFDADGSVVPESVAARRSPAEGYEAQAAFLNAQIKELVEPLLAVPEEDRPIIVLAADEGPYPPRYEGDPEIAGGEADFDWSAASDDELRIKFGILHAMYLPGIPAEGIPADFTDVNTFRFVFREYFGADLPLLRNRILAPGRGNELVDLTERLGVHP
jgi:hypothetical protein